MDDGLFWMGMIYGVAGISIALIAAIAIGRGTIWIVIGLVLLMIGLNSAMAQDSDNNYIRKADATAQAGSK